jgi:hypothetical protein
MRLAIVQARNVGNAKTLHKVLVLVSLVLLGLSSTRSPDSDYKHAHTALEALGVALDDSTFWPVFLGTNPVQNVESRVRHECLAELNTESAIDWALVARTKYINYSRPPLVSLNGVDGPRYARIEQLRTLFGATTLSAQTWTPNPHDIVTALESARAWLGPSDSIESVDVSTQRGIDDPTGITMQIYIKSNRATTINPASLNVHYVTVSDFTSARVMRAVGKNGALKSSLDPVWNEVAELDIDRASSLMLRRSAETRRGVRLAGLNLEEDGVLVFAPIILFALLLMINAFLVDIGRLDRRNHLSLRSAGWLCLVPNRIAQFLSFISLVLLPSTSVIVLGLRFHDSVFANLLYTISVVLVAALSVFTFMITFMTSRSLGLLERKGESRKRGGNVVHPFE